jgi:hypothetical protein
MKRLGISGKLKGTMTKARASVEDFQYDVCFSFAGEDRRYVEQVAETLRQAGVRVFYDRYEQVGLWGKDLYAHLNDIYTTAARYCVLFVSRNYARKIWTNHERAAAQERAIQEHGEYILPARFDDTAIPGLRRTLGYVELRKIKPPQLAQMIVEKLGGVQLSNYLPPMPDLLLRSYVEEHGEADPMMIYDRASHFLEALRRTNLEEREAIIQLFLNTCIADLPRNVHMNVDLLARITRSSEGRLLRLFGNLRSLGFYARCFKRSKEKAHVGEDRIISVEWHDLYQDAGTEGNATDVAYLMMNVSDFAHCNDCALAALRRLDFSHLSSNTLTKEAQDVETGRRIPNIGRELRKLHPISVSQRAKHRGKMPKAKSID